MEERLNDCYPQREGSTESGCPISYKRHTHPMKSTVEVIDM